MFRCLVVLDMAIAPRGLKGRIFMSAMNKKVFPRYLSDSDQICYIIIKYVYISFHIISYHGLPTGAIAWRIFLFGGKSQNYMAYSFVNNHTLVLALAVTDGGAMVRTTRLLAALKRAVS